VNIAKPYDPDHEVVTFRDKVVEWWRLWWDETLIIVGVSLLICAIVYGGWYAFQMQAPMFDQGVVQELEFTAEYEEYHDGGTTCWGRDKNGACTFSTQNPDIHHVHCIGGCYALVVHGCSNRRRGDEFCRDETVTVSEFHYRHCRRGQLWIDGETTCRPR
jgi:hypothetical protein